MRAILRAMHRPVYAARTRALTARIARHLRPSDRVLDVGCGEGTLAAAVLAHPACPAGVSIEGLENRPRGGEPIRVTPYNGGRFPFEDRAFDVVVIADVLHHEERPDDLLAECVRVARRVVIVKDHQLRGWLAGPRVRFIDWAANIPYGVKCLFRYNTTEQWRETASRHGLRAAAEELSMRDLYPIGLNTLFGGGIQYFAVLERNPGAITNPAPPPNSPPAAADK